MLQKHWLQLKSIACPLQPLPKIIHFAGVL
jgi:hypothetical protein